MYNWSVARRRTSGIAFGEEVPLSKEKRNRATSSVLERLLVCNMVEDEPVEAIRPLTLVCSAEPKMVWLRRMIRSRVDAGLRKLC